MLLILHLNGAQPLILDLTAQFLKSLRMWLSGWRRQRDPHLLPC